jgi:hypothetical protein
VEIKRRKWIWVGRNVRQRKRSVEENRVKWIPQGRGRVGGKRNNSEGSSKGNVKLALSQNMGRDWVQRVELF